MTSRERQRIFLPKTQQHSLNWSNGTLCNNDEMQSVENKQAALLSGHSLPTSEFLKHTALQHDSILSSHLVRDRAIIRLRVETPDFNTILKCDLSLC